MNAAIAGFGPQDRVAIPAFIKELTPIRLHSLCRTSVTFRTGDCCAQVDHRCQHTSPKLCKTGDYAVTGRCTVSECACPPIHPSSAPYTACPTREPTADIIPAIFK